MYRQRRKSLERWAKTRPQYQDLVAMVLNEVLRQLNHFQINLIIGRGEGVNCDYPTTKSAFAASVMVSFHILNLNLREGSKEQKTHYI